MLTGAGQLADRLKQATRFANRPLAALAGFFMSEKVFNRHVENRRKFFDLIRAQRNRVAFPYGVSGLRDAQLLGDMGLRKSKRLTSGMHMFPERRARILRRSACLHADSVQRRNPS